LPDHILPNFLSALNESSGVILISGTAGAGKTTSAYAAIRHLLQSDAPKSIVTLEDPIECELEGTAQSQINPTGDYDWASGLKAILRQDPEAMLIGEIRDAKTAGVVFQAAMAGQLVVTTLHARSVMDALQRLLDLGVTYQQLRGGLRFLMCQRLLPRLCVCQQQSEPTSERCEICGGSGTAGRMLLAEILPELEGEFAKAVAAHADSAALQALALSLNMTPLATLAAEAVAAGKVAEADVSSSI
jgi:type II secretory ATPase GspE/PulE/Tfp pilus assembly ATPase PilB-like protein